MGFHLRTSSCQTLRMDVARVLAPIALLIVPPLGSNPPGGDFIPIRDLRSEVSSQDISLMTREMERGRLERSLLKLLRTERFRYEEFKIELAKFDKVSLSVLEKPSFPMLGRYLCTSETLLKEAISQYRALPTVEESDPHLEIETITAKNLKRARQDLEALRAKLVDTMRTIEQDGRGFAIDLKTDDTFPDKKSKLPSGFAEARQAVAALVYAPNHDPSTDLILKTESTSLDALSDDGRRPLPPCTDRDTPGNRFFASTSVKSFLGTGFLANSTYLVFTARHVYLLAEQFAYDDEKKGLKDYLGNEIKAIDYYKYIRVLFLCSGKGTHPKDRIGTLQNAAYLDANDPVQPSDVAILELKPSTTLKLPKPIQLADKNEVVVTAFSLGYPHGWPLTVASPAQASRANPSETEAPPNTPPPPDSAGEILHEISTGSGQSGSPILRTGDCKLIGIHYLETGHYFGIQPTSGAKPCALIMPCSRTDNGCLPNRAIGLAPIRKLIEAFERGARGRI